MCFAKPPGPSQEQKDLAEEQKQALKREEEALLIDRKKIGQKEVRSEESRRRSGATVSGMFGSRTGNPLGQGSMFQKR